MTLIQMIAQLSGARGGSMKVYVKSKEQILEKRADSRGRVTLGSEFANTEVQLAVLEVDGDE